ncbi:unnamed protein product [Clonostachys chloroleuca]|uniref:Mitochondrial import receptor subunit n=1 Tax=Clonostachys chloroleuca TaxID=1926264 RepID=A0AA35LVB2_9HYPO|nr:unnamed protein product [Clonostachys chloroleuca]
MLELYVWGQAFGLASIDPECLAIIAYLHHAAPKSGWRIIPFNDPSTSPLDHLPALKHDGVWTNGFRQIVNYVKSHSLCRDLDENLSAAQQADNVAYSAHLSCHAALLLDVTLYLSAANWSATTLPAYSKFLPYPIVWTIPPLIRAEATKRVEHLGLAELDSDFDPSSSLHLSTGREFLPESFRRSLPVGTKKTVREEMTPEQLAAIRLTSLTEDCLSILDDLLPPSGDNVRFFGSEVSSLDCLAFGYLALLHDAPVPRPFVKDWVEQNRPRISSFVANMKASLVGLPFSSTERLGVLRVGARTLETIILNGPELGAQLIRGMLRTEEGATNIGQRTLVFAMGALAASATMGYGYHYYRSLQPFGLRTQVWTAPRAPSLSQFGELGSILDSALGPMPSSAGNFQGLSSPGRIVDTDSEVD